MTTTFRAVATALAMIGAGCSKPAAIVAAVVEVMELSTSNVARSSTIVGQLDSPQNVEVRARVESFLDKILFQEGSLVEKDAPLFLLDKKLFEERLAAAKGALAEAQAALGKTRLDVERLTPLAP